MSPHGQGSIVDARAAAPALEGQGRRAVPARLRRHRLRHHDHAVGRRRDGAHRREPVRPGVARSSRSSSRSRCSWSSARSSCRGFRRPSGWPSSWSARYLALNCDRHRSMSLQRHRRAIPRSSADWRAALFAQHGSPLMIGAMAVILFPKLALGLSGFETGVAVMPLVRGDATDTRRRTGSAASATRRSCWRTAALIMSVLLIGSSLVTTLLIPADGVPARAARPTGARWRTWRTSTSARLRHDLRRQHDRHPLVRRRVGDGRAC